MAMPSCLAGGKRPRCPLFLSGVSGRAELEYVAVGEAGVGLRPWCDGADFSVAGFVQSVQLVVPVVGAARLIQIRVTRHGAVPGAAPRQRQLTESWPPAMTAVPGGGTPGRSSSWPSAMPG